MKVYIPSKIIIGACGPCSFINLTNLKGSTNLEKALSESGRIKPFYASGHSAFLVWADKYNKNLIAFVQSKNINQKMINLMVRYEKIPKEKIKEYSKRVKRLIEKRNKKYCSKIKHLKNPIKKINEFLDNGQKVAVLVSDYYLNRPRKPVPHWIIAYKRLGNYYYFMDSANKNGLTKLSKSELIKSFRINKKAGYLPQLVVETK